MLSKKLTFQDVCSLVLHEKRVFAGTVEEREDNFLQGQSIQKQEAYNSIKEILKSNPDGLTASELYRDVIQPDENGKRPVQIKQFEKFLQQVNRAIGSTDFDIYNGKYKLAIGDTAERDIETGKETPTIEDPQFDELDTPKPEDEHPSIRSAHDDYKSSLGHEEY